MSNDPIILSVRDLFSKDDQYVIPIYQRNYAWEQTHLQQLIQDIWDSCDYASNRKYYIGTLVVHETREGYETIDGQQRLTTLNIMLCYMQNKLENKKNAFSWFNMNLKYQLRDKATSVLTQLYERGAHFGASNKKDENSEEDTAIKYMYDEVQPAMENVFGYSFSQNKDAFIKCYNKFKSYLLNHVIIARVSLPADTDLNHYFEIMNTRGEQLEKHEILKARIFDALANDQQALDLAELIWQACADMNKYVQMGFATTKLRQAIFSSKWDTLKAANFDELLAATAGLTEKENRSAFSIAEALRTSASKGESSDNTEAQSDNESRFSSVINFPNFLLQVLKVTTLADMPSIPQEDHIPLDDKRLLVTFDPFLKNATFAKKFLYQLLRLRFLFDKYIIKRERVDNKEDSSWSIRNLRAESPNKQGRNSFVPRYGNTYKDDDEQNALVMIQSMFHVSLPSQSYKNWLCAALWYLSKHNDGNGLYDYLTDLSHAYMLDRFAYPFEEPVDYYTIIFQNRGKAVNRCPRILELPRFDTYVDVFYFNYLDMQLWLEYKDKYKWVRNFVFTSRNSVEHFYPQHPDNGAALDDDYLHSFGNLCLISRSRNSQLSNKMPLKKTEFYDDSNIDSIKQAMMMKLCKKDRKWDEDEIDAHAQAMEEVLINSLKR